MTKTKTAPKPTEVFVHDAVAVRTVDLSDQSYGGFQWPTEIGAIVECPDWNPRPTCGGGFHALLDGIGNWGLTYRDEGMVWQVVGVKRDECVAIDEDKVKFPRCVLLSRGEKADALKLIVPALVEAIQKDATAKIASGEKQNAAATGDSGHAAATGDRGHAAATGDRGVAVSLGYEGTATAGATGWIVLAYCKPKWPFPVERVERFKVGDEGVEAGKTYRLSKDGKPIEAKP